MPYSPKVFTCPDCGIPVIRRRAAKRVVRCPVHAAEHSASNARQLHERKGPQYDKWRAANLAAAQRAFASPAAGECS